MRIVVALGGNALLQRGQKLTSTNQRENIRDVASSLALIAEKHQLIITHGNGPQVGLLALHAEAYDRVEIPPLDVLGAQTAGGIGYMIEQEMSSLLSHDRPIATLITMVVVDKQDPAFANPTKFIGPIYCQEEAQRLETEKGWTMKLDGVNWRRVVASPKPQGIFQLKPIKWLLEKNTVVICAGGGGIPISVEGKQLCGADVVIDKDLTSAMLATDLDADLYIMVTDVAGVFREWGTPQQQLISCISPRELEEHDFAAGSMGPKVAGGCDFVRRTGKRAAIGLLTEVEKIIKGEAGTLFIPDP